MKEFAKPFRVTFDTGTDAAYIYLRDIAGGGVKRTIEVELPNGNVNLDFDSEGRMVGIEVLGACDVLPEGFVP